MYPSWLLFPAGTGASTRPSTGCRILEGLIGGDKTSVSLEDAFWAALREIALRNRATLSGLVGSIDSQRQHVNLSSAVRLFVLNHYRQRIEAEASANPGAWPATSETQPGKSTD
jgi:predicted DNA-binding ribbon-helix-helix protein